jgi:hypothetical protein
MRLRHAIALLLGAVAFIAVTLQVQAQSSNGGRWELLGEKKVGLWLDKDVINLDQDDDWYKERRYRELRFDVKDNDIYLNRVRLVYFNGHDEDLRVDRLIHDGDQYSLRLDGERGYVRRIELSYRSRLNFEGRATVKIYGESTRSRDGDRVTTRDDRDGVRDRDRADRDRGGDLRDRDRDRGTIRDDVNDLRDRGRATVRDREGDDIRDRDRSTVRDREGDDVRDRDRAARRDNADERQDDGDRRWVELGCRRVSLADRDRDTIDVGKREGWYRAIRLRAEGNDVEVMRVEVVYGNGAPDELDVRRVIRDGRRSETIDLKGSEKTIDQIHLVYRRLNEERGQTRVCADGLLAG